MNSPTDWRAPRRRRSTRTSPGASAPTPLGRDIDAWQRGLLELAFEATMRLPAMPYERERSALQASIAAQYVAALPFGSARTEAGVVDADDPDDRSCESQLFALQQLLRSVGWQRAKFAREAVRLYRRAYGDETLRPQIERCVRAAVAKLPATCGVELLLALGGVAAELDDALAVGRWTDEVRGRLRRSLPGDGEVVRLRGRVAGLLHRAHLHDAAGAELEAAIADVEAEPGGRSRLAGLVGLTLALVAGDYEPPAPLRRRLQRMRAGLGKPW